MVSLILDMKYSVTFRPSVADLGVTEFVGVVAIRTRIPLRFSTNGERVLMTVCQMTVLCFGPILGVT